MPRLTINEVPEANRRCEVFVIGCGPAGSTISAMLAQKGRDVAVVDKDRHPRFHIGESLLPLNMPILQELGVWQELNQIGIRKDAAEFESHAHSKTVCFEFSEAFDKRWPHAFQVRRSEFDHMLLKNAADKGARIYEGARVTSVEFGNLARNEDSIVSLKLEDGTAQTWRTKFLVDASGRDTFLSNRFGIKRKNKKHASAAIFGHFRNARRNVGSAEGNITIVWFAPRLVLVHPAQRRHHQCRRGVLAGLHEIARNRPGNIFHADHRPGTRDCDALGQCATDGTGNRHRQLFVRFRAHERRRLPHGR